MSLFLTWEESNGSTTRKLGLLEGEGGVVEVGDKEGWVMGDMCSMFC